MRAMVWGNNIALEASKRIDRWGMNALLTFGHLALRMQGTKWQGSGGS
jgi:hypothetical protein